MKAKYTTPTINVNVLIYENELAAGFNPGSNPPNPPKTGGAQAKEDNPDNGTTQFDLWDDKE